MSVPYSSVWERMDNIWWQIFSHAASGYCGAQTSGFVELLLGESWWHPFVASAPPCFSLSLQMVCEQTEVFASACALARAFPLFTHRSGASRRAEKRTVMVEFFLVGQDNGPVEVSTLQVGV